MKERKGVITFQGNPLTLVGSEAKVGDQAPDCELLDNELSPVSLSSYRGKICVISAVPSKISTTASWGVVCSLRPSPASNAKRVRVPVGFLTSVLLTTEPSW